MPESYTRRQILSVRLFLFLLFCMGYQLANGQNSGESAFKQSYTSYRQQEAWDLYPFTVQLNAHTGFILPLPLLDIATDNIQDKFLWALGGRIDISLLYARKWIWEHFDCYPKLGLLTTYTHIPTPGIDKKGKIWGSILYIEPNYNHLSGWEFLPRFGVGIAFVEIPGTFSSLAENKNTPAPQVIVAPYRDEISLNLTFGLLLKYRLTPHLHFDFGLGVDYLPGPKTSLADKTINLYTASLGCSYTVNPSTYNPDRKIGPRKSRVDLAYLSSFRKMIPPTITSPEGNNVPGNRISEEYYYLGGLHVQWSFPLLNNHALVFGSEWIKDLALKKEIEKQLIKDNLQASGIVGHEFLWGKLIFGQYAGIYVLNNALNPGGEDGSAFNNLLYIRLGLNYRITDYLCIGTNLKTSIIMPDPKSIFAPEYMHIDYLDFRIGYSF